MPVESGLVAGRYELRRLRGAGPVGQVWEADDRQTGARVAVKTYHAHLGEDPAFRAAALRAATGAALVGHPAAVGVVNTGDGRFVVSEYVDGASVRELLERQRQLRPEAVVQLGFDVCTALGAAGEQGVVHGNVKPENLLVVSGCARVGDFALTATAAGAGLPAAAPYLAPEVSQTGEGDARSDVYAVGCCLYEMVTGQPPFQGPTPFAVAAKHAGEDPLPPSAAGVAIPPKLEALILRALAKDPADRYPTAAQLRLALQQVVLGRDGSRSKPARSRTAAPRPADQPAAPAAPPPSAAGPRNRAPELARTPPAHHIAAAPAAAARTQAAPAAGRRPAAPRPTAETPIPAAPSPAQPAPPDRQQARPWRAQDDPLALMETDGERQPTARADQVSGPPDARTHAVRAPRGRMADPRPEAVASAAAGNSDEGSGWRPSADDPPTVPDLPAAPPVPPPAPTARRTPRSVAAAPPPPDADWRGPLWGPDAAPRPEAVAPSAAVTADWRPDAAWQPPAADEPATVPDLPPARVRRARLDPLDLMEADRDDWQPAAGQDPDLEPVAAPPRGPRAEPRRLALSGLSGSSRVLAGLLMVGVLVGVVIGLVGLTGPVAAVATPGRAAPAATAPPGSIPQAAPEPVDLTGVGQLIALIADDPEAVGPDGRAFMDRLATLEDLQRDQQRAELAALRDLASAGADTGGLTRWFSDVAVEVLDDTLQ